MDFITSSILGGIVYDSLKFGVYKFSGLLREKLRKYAFSDEELEIIENLAETNLLNANSSIDEIHNALKSSNEIENLLKSKKSSVTQINNITNNYGAVIGQNSGEIKIDAKK